MFLNFYRDAAYVKKYEKDILVVKKPPRWPLPWLEPERKLCSLTF